MKLYHGTILSNLNSIKQQGLVPACNQGSEITGTLRKAVCLTENKILAEIYAISRSIDFNDRPVVLELEIDKSELSYGIDTLRINSIYRSEKIINDVFGVGEIILPSKIKKIQVVKKKEINTTERLLNLIFKYHDKQLI